MRGRKVSHLASATRVDEVTRAVPKRHRRPCGPCPTTPPMAADASAPMPLAQYEGVGAWVERTWAWARSEVESAAAEGPLAPYLVDLDWRHAAAATLMACAMVLGTKRVLRWPVFVAIILFLAAELAAYFFVRYFVWLLELLLTRRGSRKVRELRAAMKRAESYAEWSALAEQADTHLGCDPWKKQPSSRYFNYPLLANLMAELRSSRRSGDVARLTTTLQTCLHKNPAGIMNEHLYSKSLVGTKHVIGEYIEEVRACLEYLKQIALADADARTPVATPGRRASKSPAASRRRSGSRNGRSRVSRSSRKQQAVDEPTIVVSPHSCEHDDDVASASSLLRFFQSVKRQYGCTALCLSGGASLGNYSWSFCKALLDEGVLPRVLSGTSSGAVVAALVCTRTDEELRTQLNPKTLAEQLNSFEESWFKCSWRFWQKRCMYDNDTWLQKLQWFANAQVTPKMTFLEAHRRTGRILNITCTSQRKHNPAMLLNYLTTPNVCIDTAILASAAVPGFIAPVVLMEKIHGKLRPYHDKDLRWCDGSLQRDLPISELSEQFGANFFLVAQTNPHIIPFFFNSRGQSGTPSSWRRRTGGYRGGFLLSALELFLKEDMKKNLRVLSELDLVPSILGSDFSFLFLQDFQGQVTLVPNATLRDYMRIICDPSESDLVHFFTEGRLTAWRKFSMIQNRMLVGRTLNTCLRDLTAAMHPNADANEELLPPGASPNPYPVQRSQRLLHEQDMHFTTL